MHDEDALHPNSSLQEKLNYIYELRRAEHPKGRVNFEDNSNYKTLLKAYGNPHLHLPPVIHIAGTNGKGSTLAILKSILEQGGYKVHAYTSPHLKVFNERLYCAGKDIDDQTLEALLDETFTKNEGHRVTFFEFTTAMAFAQFTRAPADIVLLETGMGGRLDCTNIVPAPLATVITSISYDHMEFLGTTLPQIAGEKAGIMKQGTPCIIAPQSQEAIESGVLDVFIETAQKLSCSLSIGNKDWACERQGQHMMLQSKKYPLPNLTGAHQIDNAGTALATLDVIKDKFPVSQEAIANGLQTITWPGRLEHITNGDLAGLLPKDWELWFDGGHNIAGAAAIAKQIKLWKNKENKPTHIFLGMREGKDIEGVINILKPHVASLQEFEIGDDLSPHLRKLISSENKEKSANVLICGSLYNYS